MPNMKNQIHISAISIASIISFVSTFIFAVLLTATWSLGKVKFSYNLTILLLISSIACIITNLVSLYQDGGRITTGFVIAMIIYATTVYFCYKLSNELKEFENSSDEIVKTQMSCNSELRKLYKAATWTPILYSLFFLSIVFIFGTVLNFVKNQTKQKTQKKINKI